MINALSVALFYSELGTEVYSDVLETPLFEVDNKATLLKPDSGGGRKTHNFLNKTPTQFLYSSLFCSEMMMAYCRLIVKYQFAGSCLLKHGKVIMDDDVKNTYPSILWPGQTKRNVHM